MINCERCGAGSMVVDSRAVSDTMKRRRECIQCKHRWRTYEVQLPSDARKLKNAGDELRRLEDAIKLCRSMIKFGDEDV